MPAWTPSPSLAPPSASKGKISGIEGTARSIRTVPLRWPFSEQSAAGRASPPARRVSLSTGNPCRSVASLSPLVPSRTDHFRERRRPRRRLIKGHTAYWLGGLSTIEPLPSDKSSDSHVSRIVLTENPIRKSANTRCSAVISLRMCAVGKRLSPAKETPAVMGCSAQREWLRSCAQRGRLFICGSRHCGNPPKKGDAPWDGCGMEEETGRGTGLQARRSTLWSARCERAQGREPCYGREKERRAGRAVLRKRERKTGRETRATGERKTGQETRATREKERKKDGPGDPCYGREKEKESDGAALNQGSHSPLLSGLPAGALRPPACPAQAAQKDILHPSIDWIFGKMRKFSLLRLPSARV